MMHNVHGDRQNPSTRLEMASRDKDKELQEFVKVKLFAEGSSKVLQDLYGDLLPPMDEFLQMAQKQLEEALKPRPTVRPIIRRRRRFQLSSIGQDTSSGATVVPSSQPGPSCAPSTSSVVPSSESTSSVVHVVPILESESGSAPDISSVLPADSSSSSGSSNAPVISTLSTEGACQSYTSKELSPKIVGKSSIDNVAPENSLKIPPAYSTQTARKSTTVKVRSNLKKKLKKCKPCSLVLLDLLVSNLSNSVKPLLEQYELVKRGGEVKSTSKILERKDSTDSGVAFDDDDCVVSPQVRTSRIEREVDTISATCTTVSTEQVGTENRVDKPSPSTTTVRNEPETRVEKRVDEPSTTTTTTTYKPSPSTSKAKKRKIDAIPKGPKADATTTTYKPSPSTSKAKKRKIDAIPKGPKADANLKEPTPKKVASKESSSLKSPKYSKTGGDIPAGEKRKAKVSKKSKPSTAEKEPTKQLPSIKVSIPWDDDLRRVAVPDKNRRYLIKNLDHDDNNNNNKTVLPKDVVPSVAFDVSRIEMSPLECKRFKEPAPTQFFTPYAGQPFVCVPCNSSFPSEQELAKHKLLKHSSSYNF